MTSGPTTGKGSTYKSKKLLARKGNKEKMGMGKNEKEEIDLA